jgi:hypothetical protein
MQSRDFCANTSKNAALRAFLTISDRLKTIENEKYTPNRTKISSS